MNFSRLIVAISRSLGAVFRFFGLRDVIIFEAEKGGTQNIEAILGRMLNDGWDTKFNFVLVTEHPDSLANLKSRHISVCKRTKYREDLKAHIKLFLKKAHTVLIVDENHQIKKNNPQTVHVYLSHGSPVKSTRAYYNCTDDTDYSLCQSEFWRPIESYQLLIPENKLIIKGFPRNDFLFSSHVRMADFFGESYKKTVVWYPTFRQHQIRHYTRSTNSAGVPVIHSEEKAKQVNAIAAKYDVLLVVKPHPAQDLSLIKALDLDHLKFIYDDFFIEHGITAHEFLAKTDALITDYSSIVFDYLLTEKPIALTWEDYDEYKEKVGFAIDMDILRSCSTMLNSIDDFDGFFRDIVEGNDPLRSKREEVMHLTNQFTDGNSTKRVVDWLETLLK